MPKKKKAKTFKNTDSVVPMGPAKEADRKAHKILNPKKRGKK